MISEAERLAADELLNELESSGLEVMLVPQRWRTNEGGMIRVACSRNVDWYRRFCAAWPSSRRRRNLAPDTLIKRAHTIRGLAELADGKCRSSYAERLRPWVARRAVESIWAPAAVSFERSL